MVSTTFNYVFYTLSLVLIYALNKIIGFFIRSVTRKKLLADLENALILIIRFFMVLLVLYSSVYFLNIGEETTLGLTIFLGSIVSFASIHTIQNFISGIYILITEPFSVNDFVRIGNSEGVVTEISLNYTSILNFEGLIEFIPNKKIINSTIINFDQKLKVNVTEQERLEWSKKILEHFDDTEITRYTFVWGAPLIDLDIIKEKIDTVCKTYEPIFGYIPTYFAYTLNHRFEFSFTLSSDSPITILKNKTDFLDDISAAFH